jgi:lysophospholipase L1-like esterase
MVTSARIVGIRALAGLIATVLLPIAAFAQPKIIFIGDSITRGVGATNPETNGFVGQLSERFPELLVANAGCGGSTIRDWTSDGPSLNCFFRDAWNLLVEPELPAQITHIMLGTNDALGFFEFFPDGSMGRWVPSEEYASRLRALVERAPGLVLISSPPKNPAELSGPVDDRLRAYRDAIDAMVGEYRYAAQGVDFYALLDPDNDLLGVHPNDRGHARMADELERRILHLLPKGALSPCRNAVACAPYPLLPQHHHPRGRRGRVGRGRGAT